MCHQRHTTTNLMFRHEPGSRNAVMRLLHVPRFFTAVDGLPQVGRLLPRSQAICNPGQDHLLKALADKLAMVSGIDIKQMRYALGSQTL